MENSQFPDWYTIDDDGLSSLIYFLKKEFQNKTVKIYVEEEQQYDSPRPPFAKS